MKRLMLIFLILCTSLFAQSNIDEDTVHFIGQASAFTVGSELVGNGTFDDGTVWVRGTGWQPVADGKIEKTAGSEDSISQNITGLTDGRVYRIQFEVVSRSAGSVTAVFDGTEIGDKNAAGVYTGYLAATGTDADIAILGDSSFAGFIDNVSVVAWVGNLNAGGGTTIAGFTGTLTDYMSATGGVLHHEAGLAITDQGGLIEITTGTAWDTVPQVGGFVTVDFSSALGSGVDDGIFEVTAVISDGILIDTAFTVGDDAKTAEVWIGGAFPDIATATNASTLSEDTDGTYRKRYICVNVDQKVDAVTDFVAEDGGSGETALREDDGSRKLIGFYDSISVVTAHSSYRVVSDMDEGQIYYAGARKAFNSVEGFPGINPNGKWIEWNAKGNSINILELNTSNFEIRNFKIYNTATGGTNALLHIDDAEVVNHAYVNCWFGTADLLYVSDSSLTRAIFRDCYFDNAIATYDVHAVTESTFRNCIMNGTGRTFAFDNGTNEAMFFDSCLFYKSVSGVLARGHEFLNCNFFDQTGTCVYLAAATYSTRLTNCILSPAAANNNAIQIVSAGGSLNAASANNIMYSVSAGAVLTNPIAHNQISPNPPLPVGTLEVDPQFVNSANGDFRLRAGSPALNAGLGSLFNGRSTVGAWQPYALPVIRRLPRPRYGGSPIYK